LTEFNAAIDDAQDINQIRIDQKSLLRFAAEQGSRRICERLVSNGANVDEVGGARKFSLLHHAAASRNLGMANILLGLGAKPSPETSNSATPLHIAARTGQGFLAHKLLECKANVNAQDTQGRTPLHWAVSKHDLNMVKVLLKHRCQVDLSDNQGRMPLMLAQAEGQNEMADLLIAHGAKIDHPAQSQVDKVAEPPNYRDWSRS